MVLRGKKKCCSACPAGAFLQNVPCNKKSSPQCFGLLFCSGANNAPKSKKVVRISEQW